jgi:RimJ/RimL family protein N-acetyltransferase
MTHEAKKDIGVSLRSLELKDADQYFDLYDSNRDHISSYDKRLASAFKTISEVSEHLSPYSSSYRKHFAVLDRESEFIGSTALFIKSKQEAEIAYWIDKNHIGKGLAVAACRLLIHHAFDHIGVEKISAVIAPTNEPSIRTARKLGFTRSVILEDDEIYSLIRSQAA